MHEIFLRGEQGRSPMWTEQHSGQTLKSISPWSPLPSSHALWMEMG